MKYLDELNEPQREAVLHKDGPLLIVAGAGAGKTKTVTHRILHLMKNGVAPRNILAVTFTNKAAKEMNDRVFKLATEDSDIASIINFNNRPAVSTFHSLGVRILREFHESAGLPKHFVILGESDAGMLIKQALKKLSLDPKQWEPKRMKGAISKQKGELITLDKYEADAGNEYFPRTLASIWKEYEKLLKEQGGVDFDDLILKTVLLLGSNERARKHYQDLWKYVHIDEYQDTNTSQYKLSKLLAGEHKNICCVGDGDQNIYSWRGADFRNLLNFEKDYPNAKTVLLEENYRSTANILTAANIIISKNKERQEKNLFTKKDAGEKIGLFGAYDEAEEASYVASKSRELIASGVKASDIAVLYRANFQSRALEEAFLTESVPYQVLGVKFFERKEIKDLVSYIRVALNPNSQADIRRAINVPPRGIGKVTLEKIFAGQSEQLPPKMREKISDFKSALADIRESVLNNKTSVAMKFAMRRSGLEGMYKNKSDEDVERLENMKELVTLAAKYDDFEPEEGITKLLEEAALASDQDSLSTTKKKEEEAVRLMTVHASKGLEFPYVFIVGLEQDLFPHGGFGDGSVDRGEEERRLFYVAITRAEKKAFLTYSAVRTIFGMKQVNIPSEFITDIDDELLEQEFFQTII